MTDAILLQQWRDAWPRALEVWSRFTTLRDPLLCVRKVAAAQEGLNGSFAMIRLADQSVVIDLETIVEQGLQDYAVEILAHEIGHHVLAPATIGNQYRLLARLRRALPTLERLAPLVANLYTDLLINDRLQRQSSLRMADIYRQLRSVDAQDAAGKPKPSLLWALYMRIYEHLWKLDAGTLTPADRPDPTGTLEIDAWLGARLIRVYANDWVFAAGRFGTLLLPYLESDQSGMGPAILLHDTQSASEGCEPGAALDMDPDELEEAVHPAEDPQVSGAADAPAPLDTPDTRAGGQARDPFEFGEILKAAGLKLSDHDIAVRYYRQRAQPHLIPYPRQARPEAPEPHMEGTEPWELGDPFDEIDWLQTLLQSPTPIPGLTTVRRHYGREAGVRMAPVPIDLDMYVDSSGSMPNPQRLLSYPALAGAIIALSALRARSRVQVTLWSNKRQCTGTDGFTDDDEAVLRVLTGYFGSGTDFPIHRLRDTYATARPRPAHILMISDSGITSMFDQDEKGNSGWDVSAHALRCGGAGGTMALELHAQWQTLRGRWAEQLRRARDEQGWHIHPLNQAQDLLDFARDFARRHYSLPVTGARQ